MGFYENGLLGIKPLDNFFEIVGIAKYQLAVGRIAAIHVYQWKPLRKKTVARCRFGVRK